MGSSEQLAISNTPLAKLRVALAHDDLTQFGGGERVFLAIRELFPKAPIYTSLATGEWVRRLARNHPPEADLRAYPADMKHNSGVGERRPHTTFMQKLPLKKRLQRAYFPLYPLAFESLDLSGFDLVISSSTRFAHGIITKPETKHICYIHSPGRMFWEPKNYFGGGSKLRILLSPMLAYLRLWDFTAAQRVDRFITNSQHTAGKIKKYYHREARVIYPFVDLERFIPLVNSKSSIVNGEKELLTINHKPLTSDYFLVVSRLARWKRVDIAVEAAKKLGVRLKIVGDGPERRSLEKLGQGRIEFLGWVSGEELVKLYQRCQALIMPQEEDFGIASLEAQASGRPVVAYRGGGASETIRQRRTGELFHPQTTGALAAALRKFKPERYDPGKCRKNAERFSRARFEENFLKEVERAVNSKW